MATVELVGVTVRKGDGDVLRAVDLAVDHAEVVGVVGVSGSGKTSLLRAVSGLDRVAAGEVRIDGVDVGDVPAARRDVGFVFQHPALYPTRSVRRNIAFPLELRHEHVDQIRERVGAEARALRIDGLLGRSPESLSAGEAQLVQIARAVVRNPSVLLLDEPFANVDLDRVGHLRHELLTIQRGFGVTTLVATNDPHDAMTMCDRVAVLERGAVVQVAPPLEVYERPRTAMAALLTGDADVIEVTVTTDPDGSWLVHPGFRIRAWQPGLRRYAGRRLQLVVRPEWWQLDEHGPVHARIERVQRLGTVTALWVRVGHRPMTLKLAGSVHGRLRPGDEVTVRLDRYLLLDPRDGLPADLDEP